MNRFFYYRLIAFSLILSLLIVSAGGASVFAQRQDVFTRSDFCRSVDVYSSVSEFETSGDRYSEYSEDLETEKTAYHAYLNMVFENKIGEVGLVMQELSESDADFDPVAFQQELTDRELTTWSIARDLVCSYEKYFKIVKLKSFDFTFDPSTDDRGHLELLRAADDGVGLWGKELENAKKALDLSLATYDQIALTFPMHIQYRRVIDQLVLYREQFGVLRNLLSCFPSKFVNNATTQCN